MLSRHEQDNRFRYVNRKKKAKSRQSGRPMITIGQAIRCLRRCSEPFSASPSLKFIVISPPSNPLLSLTWLRRQFQLQEGRKCTILRSLPLLPTTLPRTGTMPAPNFIQDPLQERTINTLQNWVNGTHTSIIYHYREPEIVISRLTGHQTLQIRPRTSNKVLSSQT